MSVLSIQVNSEQEFKPISEWIFCICVVAFDLELGQAIECIYPKNVIFSNDELLDICYLSFPDSNSNCVGDTQYVIRLKFKLAQDLTNSSKVFKSIVQADKNFIWGFVFFRQIRDHTLPRGYFQKSIVVFSYLPFFNLFKEITEVIAWKYFESGLNALEKFANEIQEWPQLIVEKVLYLFLNGKIFQTILPRKLIEENLFEINFGDYSTIAFNFNQNRLLTNYESNELSKMSLQLNKNVHLIWELMLIAEPVIVMASSPEICSNMVLALIKIISPLKYKGDYRPFFTIHDSDFKKIANSVDIKPSAIIGVTNPFFLKMLNHWPNIIRLNDNNDSLCVIKKIDDLRTNSKFMDATPGIYTNYKIHLQKGKINLRKFMDGLDHKNTDETMQMIALQRYFGNMTKHFIIPLEEYMISLMPNKNSISAFKAVPLLNQFNPDIFISNLKRNGPQIKTGIKGDWPGLYRKFFRSVNFSYWFNQKYNELNQQIQISYLNLLAKTDIVEWSKNRSEVEVVDMIIKIRNKMKILKEFDQTIAFNIQNKLNTNLQNILSTLPNDLQNILKTS